MNDLHILHLLVTGFQIHEAKDSLSKKMKQLSLVNCLPEPGKGLQTQRPERKAAGYQTHAGQHDSEGGGGEAQAGKRACTCCVSDLSSAPSIFNQIFAILIPLMLIFMDRFNIPQLLKQAAEYKMKVKVMKEQEIDMKIQVQ